jgi:hypothetical protein
VPGWHCASVGNRTTKAGSQLRRWVPARSRRHLRDAITHRRDAERPLPAIGLGDISTQDRLRPIRACPQPGVELVEHALDAVLLNLSERLTINARRATIPFHSLPCLLKDVTPPD